MEIQYHMAESTERPIEIDISHSVYVYVRRNIKKVSKSIFGGPPVERYVYEEAMMTKDEFESYKNELLYKMLNSQDNTPSFDRYLEGLNTPVEYENGHTYKPKWADTIYFGLIQKGMLWPELFPMKIYDSTGFESNAVEMTLEELRNLALFLEQKKEELFLLYKGEII